MTSKIQNHVLNAYWKTKYITLSKPFNLFLSAANKVREYTCTTSHYTPLLYTYKIMQQAWNMYIFEDNSQNSPSGFQKQYRNWNLNHKKKSKREYWLRKSTHRLSCTLILQWQEVRLHNSISKQHTSKGSVSFSVL